MQYKVISSEINKFGFGVIKIEGGESLHTKGKYGFSTGDKSMPTCNAGDTIEGDIDTTSQYATIKNVKVVTGNTNTPTLAPVAADYSELNRRCALELALKYKPESEVGDILANANIFDEFISKGTDSEYIQGIMLQGNGSLTSDDEIPY